MTLVRASLVWFRQDLRLQDNPALEAALDRGAPIIPVFIWAPDEEKPWSPGAASRWWLHHSLKALSRELHQCKSRLIIGTGPTQACLSRWLDETGADAIFWNRRYEPAVCRRDQTLQAGLRWRGVSAESLNGSLLHEPSTIQNSLHKPFRVFSAFWRVCAANIHDSEPRAVPDELPSPARWPRSLQVSDLSLDPCQPWTTGLDSAWHPGSLGGRNQLQVFLESAFSSYHENRNRPDIRGTSRLSPHLHFGEISPRQIWRQVRRRADSLGWEPDLWQRSQFLTEIGWREFAHYLLHHFPHTTERPLRSEFSHFPWRDNTDQRRAWETGRTGYPLVDAGVRELWATGWMHNRVRMVAASFLVKHLMISWLEGARWFWDTLVDADLANNTLGWQWTAGCGADAAPFFRIFNPISQGAKFDPQGAYVRRWVPELARLDQAQIHCPHQAEPSQLLRAGISLGKDYPQPVVPHIIARERALEAYAATLKHRKTEPRDPSE
jgi:deoxyribodipyrimidine photo-lyase